MTFNLFGVNGGDIRLDITEAELMSLDETKREIVFAILSDHEAEITDEADRRKCEKALHASVTNLQNEEAERDACSRTTFQDAHRRTIRARQISMGIDNPAFEVPPLDQKAIDAADLRVEKARAAVDTARTALTIADQKLRASRAAIAASLKKWINPVSFDEAHKAAMKSHQERKLREAPFHMSPLDAMMSGSRGHSVNVGFGRKHRLRAATRILTGH